MFNRIQENRSINVGEISKVLKTYLERTVTRINYVNIILTYELRIQKDEENILCLRILFMRRGYWLV
jgi:hypothetical protein